MAANPLKGLGPARDAASWLVSHGQKGRGANVFRVCAAHDAQEREISTLRAEVARLRKLTTPIAKARARADRVRSPLALELMATILALEEIRRTYEQEGGGPAIHVPDGEALIDLLHRVSAELA